jgi:hypothetical protein
MEIKQFENIVGKKREYMSGFDAIDIQYVKELEHQYEIIFNMLYNILIINKKYISMFFLGEYQDFSDIEHKRFENYKDKK